ncbi:MAG: hypothetical protein JWP65_3770 [Ramlibacter sp.]|jgi:hypothetical protein|uniref:hypothetical protein n=1 Tax=Ramlibacter sp. TaxID=1917967 RepID=UPI00260C1499|nr:hypothetical protein [Ramlibacter sp.]MDB5753349.1 hypothetical protein [Ramlibacter sp.]
MKALWLGALLAGAAAAMAQVQAPAPCPLPAQTGLPQMLGLWRAEFQGLWQGATLLIEPHPEDEGSFRGAINRNGERGVLAGDLQGGELALRESDDGKRLSALWLGDVVEGSCGREIRGSWQAEGDVTPRNFVLRKQ